MMRRVHGLGRMAQAAYWCQAETTGMPVVLPRAMATRRALALLGRPAG
jgi:hypothetical protein